VGAAVGNTWLLARVPTFPVCRVAFTAAAELLQLSTKVSSACLLMLTSSAPVMSIRLLLKAAIASLKVAATRNRLSMRVGAVNCCKRACRMKALHCWSLDDMRQFTRWACKAYSALLSMQPICFSAKPTHAQQLSAVPLEHCQQSESEC